MHEAGINEVGGRVSVFASRFAAFWHFLWACFINLELMLPGQQKQKVQRGEDQSIFCVCIT